MRTVKLRYLFLYPASSYSMPGSISSLPVPPVSRIFMVGQVSTPEVIKAGIYFIDAPYHHAHLLDVGITIHRHPCRCPRLNNGIVRLADRTNGFRQDWSLNILPASLAAVSGAPPTWYSILLKCIVM